jgi:curved DNA-binding protein CbpA
MSDDPFAALGLPARAGLSDEDVRAAWRRIAAATHPDRDDGGDPAAFGAAAAAYDTLRTSFGRGEALADLGRAGRAPRAARPGVRRAARHARPTGAPRRGVSGRGWRFALRAAIGGGVTAAAFLAVGWTPATAGLLAGALTWTAVTGIPGLRGRGDG